MDPYTTQTKQWLDKRFKKCCDDGVYFAHQPIYGLREGHSELLLAMGYIRTYGILKALSRLECQTLLDVGGAEGYKAHLAHKLLGIDVENSDLSEEACRRCEEIFHIKSTPADIHELPFRDESFDVVLCSEALEHVSDANRATDELLRVARNALVITVPHEPLELVEQTKQEMIPHGHINAFDVTSFDNLRERGYTVIVQKLVSPLLTLLFWVIEIEPRYHKPGSRFPKCLFGLYNLSIPLRRALVRESVVAAIISIDEIVCRALGLHDALLCIVVKRPDGLLRWPRRRIRARDMLSITVPLHFLTD